MKPTTIRRIKLGSLVGIILLAGMIAGIHVYSRWALSHYKKGLLARGEKLTIEELKPNAALSAENAAGLLSEAGFRLQRLMTNDVDRLVQLHMIAPGRAWLAWRQVLPLPGINAGRGTLRKSDTNFTWQSVARLVEASQSAVAEASDAVSKNQLDFNLDYRQGPNLMLMHLSRLSVVAQFLGMTALYQLHEGSLEPAIENLQTMLRLAQLEAQEPLVISQMARGRTMRRAWHVNWEALQAPGWTDAQLAQLQQQWLDLDLVKPLVRAYEMQRAINITFYARMRSSVTEARNMLQMGTPARPSAPPANQAAPTEDLSTLMKSGADSLSDWTRNAGASFGLQFWKWFLSYSMELYSLRSSDLIIAGWRNIHTGSSWKSNIDHTRSDLERLQSKSRLSRFAELFDLSGGSVTVMGRCSETEVMRQLMIVSIALARYKLKTGKYPAALIDVTPAFLSAVPKDPINEQPMHYRLNADGTYLLYSVGIDGQDNGGDPRQKDKNSSQSPITEGKDWLWPWPATAEDIESVTKPNK